MCPPPKYNLELISNLKKGRSILSQFTSRGDMDGVLLKHYGRKLGKTRRGSFLPSSRFESSARYLTIHILFPALSRDLNPDDNQDDAHQGQDYGVSSLSPVFSELSSARQEEYDPASEKSSIDQRFSRPNAASTSEHEQGASRQPPAALSRLSKRSMFGLHSYLG